MRPIPTTEELISRIEAVLSGAQTRREARAWALDQQLSAQLRRRMADPMADEAIGALCSVLQCADQLDREGEPYFIREHDLKEWLANMRREPLPHVDTPLAPVRICEIREVEGFEYNALELPPRFETFIERLSIPTIRGLDDLDYYEIVLMRMPSGSLAMMTLYIRSNRCPIVNLECTRQSAESTAQELLELIGVEDNEDIWWNPTLFPARPKM